MDILLKLGLVERVRGGDTAGDQVRVDHHLSHHRRKWTSQT